MSVFAVFKTRGKNEEGRYIRHAYVHDKDSDTEFAVCERNIALPFKPVSVKFLSKKGEKVDSDKIGITCKRCLAICEAMSKKSEFTYHDEAVKVKQ